MKKKKKGHPAIKVKIRLSENEQLNKDIERVVKQALEDYFMHNSGMLLGEATTG